jgi:uncharacterized repeat protein (TIGR03803 family)
MTNSRPDRRWISRIRLGAGRTTLTFVVGLVLGAVATQSAQAQTFTVLYNFAGGVDGKHPVAGLVWDGAGNLYGTTSAGGASDVGTVFKLSKTGKKTVLHNFTGRSDGAYPSAGLIRDASGNLYGTTYHGGSSTNCFDGPHGCGTVFKVSATGKETVLYRFAGGTTDGCYPEAGLLRDKAGNLYGTTLNCGASGYGTVFKLDTTGSETLLHSFAGYPSDGAYPWYAGLLMDSKGNLYGVTEEGGGTKCEGFGCGVVYRLGKTGTMTVLYSFTGGTTDGCYPSGTPAMDKTGSLYGTTYGCGSPGIGILWKVNNEGIETVLHKFGASHGQGAFPVGGVIVDAEGNLYGDTTGISNGTIYERKRGGRLTSLHIFDGSDGQSPMGGLIRDAKGDLYGTAYAGGNSDHCLGVGCGTIWKLTP